MATTDSKKFYWVITQKHKLIVINTQLPFFWNKKAATDANKKYNCTVTKVSGAELEKLVKESL